jgi:hypothetical protein
LIGSDEVRVESVEFFDGFDGAAVGTCELPEGVAGFYNVFLMVFAGLGEVGGEDDKGNGECAD